MFQMAPPNSKEIRSKISESWNHLKLREYNNMQLKNNRTGGAKNLQEFGIIPAGTEYTNKQ